MSLIAVVVGSHSRSRSLWLFSLSSVMVVVDCSAGGMAVVVVDELMSQEASEAMCIMCVEWPAQRRARCTKIAENVSIKSECVTGN